MPALLVPPLVLIPVGMDYWIRDERVRMACLGPVIFAWCGAKLHCNVHLSEQWEAGMKLD